MFTNGFDPDLGVGNLKKRVLSGAIEIMGLFVQIDIGKPCPPSAPMEQFGVIA